MMLSKNSLVGAIVATTIVSSGLASAQSKPAPKQKSSAVPVAKFLKPGYSAEYSLNLGIRTIDSPQAFSGVLRIKVLDQGHKTPSGALTYILNSKGEYQYSAMRGEISTFFANNPKSGAVEIHGVRQLGSSPMFVTPEAVRPGWVKQGTTIILPELLGVPGVPPVPVKAIEREVVSTAAGDFQSFRCEGILPEPVLISRNGFDEMFAFFRVVAWYSNELGLLKAEVTSENYMRFVQIEDSKGILLGVSNTSIDAQAIYLPDGRYFGPK